MSRSALEQIEGILRTRQKKSRGRNHPYYIPSLWVDEGETYKQVAVDPLDFFISAIQKARRSHRRKVKRYDGGEWTRKATIYNLMVRTTCAFDHDCNGALDLPVNTHGFRETGTFLKAIALLPYIRFLGANTIHLLPISAIGRDGNKGTLGSPYAIRNPYGLDEFLAEPILGGDPGLEFRGFVEAAHRFGFRVVLEFVFRTAAKDSDWIAEHPEWFYWIRENLPARAPGSANELSYGSPLFSREELDAIRRDVTDHKMDNLLPPHAAYRKMFMPPPSASSVRIVEGRYVGEAPDGTLVKIPGAFADWPPDDNQPPWGDVTYLRMYDHPDFNYIAYNTIRMYDSRLARPENINTSLWEKIVGIIPFFQRQFRIDGVMIDMGHALPPELKREIIRKARSVDPDFAFWDENFSITRKSREEGYNAVFGYLWWDEHHLSKLRTFIKRCSMEGFPIPFFATPENHNTPRAASRPGGTMFSQWSWVVNQFLPGIPFLHSGFELGETHPINTGLDFSPADLSRFSSEKLPLFSAHAFPWNSRSRFPLFVRKVAGIRSRYADLLENRDPGSFTLIDQDNPSVIAVVRKSRSGRKQMGLLANGNFVQPEQVTFHLDTAKNSIKDLVAGGRQIVTDRRLSVKLQPGQCMVFEL